MHANMLERWALACWLEKGALGGALTRLLSISKWRNVRTSMNIITWTYNLRA